MARHRCKTILPVALHKLLLCIKNCHSVLALPSDLHATDRDECSTSILHLLAVERNMYR